MARRFRVVIAGDPDPVPGALQRPERRAIARSEPVRAAAVVKAVAQCDDDARRVAANQPAQTFERRCGVVRRQQHAAPGIARAFFQVQVGDREHALVGPIERPGRVDRQRGSGNLDGVGRPP